MSRLLGIKLDSNDPSPLYRQLVDQIAERIRVGSLPAGYQLPPTREFARELQVHRNTVVRAFEELTSLGYMNSTVGRGTFVADIEITPIAPQELSYHKHPLPWETLISQAASSEPYDRMLRITQGSSQYDIIDMARMEPSPDLFPIKRFQHCIDYILRTKKGNALGYSHREGLPALREQIAQDLARKGIPARMEEIMITTGSQQGLDLVVRSLLNPGDTFLMQSASYTGALCAASSYGARCIGVEEDDQGPSMKFLERLGQSKQVKGLYLMPDVNNPTGTCISEQRREEIIQWSHQYGVPLIEDDYAADLELDEKHPPPALRALDPEVIYASTFSKKLMPALRVGYIVCPPSLHKHLLPLKHAMDLGTSQLLQLALTEFLERGYMRAHLKQLLAAYRKRRDALEKALHTYLPEGIEWNHVERGPHLWLSLPEGIAPEDAYIEIRKRGVLVSPSSIHEAVNQPSPGGLRLIFIGEPTERLVDGAKRIGKALRKLVMQRRRESQTQAPTISTGERWLNGV